MAQLSRGHPTERELEILKVLWKDGPHTMRQMHEALSLTSNTGSKALLTIMNIMVKKGYLTLQRRSKAEGGNLYSAKVTQPSTARAMLQSLARRLFGSSVASAIQNLAIAGELDQAELSELRHALNELAKKHKT
ncbi:MAG TPA: BlaI/MecI/CopY family transcriptional regulator [Tepidisphaeraceae bacterium]|nr:BlaI/MecI/CopY family transcriptional regulator [Tepidisphaeraceae bacterium]